MALSTTFTQCAPETTMVGKITHNKGHFAVQGNSRSPILVPIESLLCDFLLVINTNLPVILHRLRDIAFEMSKIAIFDYPTPLVFKPPTEGFPWDDLRKIFSECQRMAKLPNGVKKLPKISAG